MEIKKLTQAAHKRFLEQNLSEIMQKVDRGYGIITIEIKDLKFAIPLRSNLNHKNGFKTVRNKKGWCGLDYSKAVIVSDAEVSQEPFWLRDKKEIEKIKNNKKIIKRQFEKYVRDYVIYQKRSDVKERDIILKFGYTTLVNFHQHLGI